MKSDRRHELQQNELADWLGEKIEAIKPHATQITLGIAGVLLAIVGGLWFFSGGDSAAASRWSSYFTALNQPRDREQAREQALEEVNNKNPGTPAALWAKMSIADTSAAQGSRAMFTDRGEAKKLLEKAEAAYKVVEAGASHDPELKARAQLGLGKVYESLCKPAEAKKYYELAATGLKDSALGKAAAADAARMKKQEQVALLEWFAVQTPKRPPPMPGFGGTIPGMPNDLPARPDISLPNVPSPSGLGLDNIGTGVPPPPGPEFPASTTPGATPPATTPTTTVPPTPTPPTPEPKTDGAKAPEPAADATKSPEPKSAEPKASEPKSTEPKPAAPKTESPKSEP